SRNPASASPCLHRRDTPQHVPSAPLLPLREKVAAKRSDEGCAELPRDTPRQKLIPAPSNPRHSMPTTPLTWTQAQRTFGRDRCGSVGGRVSGGRNVPSADPRHGRGCTGETRRGLAPA